MKPKIISKLLEFWKRLFPRKESAQIEQKIIVSDNGEVNISIKIGKQ